MKGSDEKPLNDDHGVQVRFTWGGSFSLGEVSLEDARKAMKLFSISLGEDRLRIVTPFLNMTLEMLQPLSKLDLPKEFEPTTYVAKLRELGRVRRPEDI